MYLSVLPVNETDDHRRTRAMTELEELCDQTQAPQASQGTQTDDLGAKQVWKLFILKLFCEQIQR